MSLNLGLRRTSSVRLLINTHDWPAARTSEAKALALYKSEYYYYYVVIVVVDLTISNALQHVSKTITRAQMLNILSLEGPFFNSINLHRITFDPTTVIITFQTSQSTLLNQHTNWFQSLEFSEFCTFFFLLQ